MSQSSRRCQVIAKFFGKKKDFFQVEKKDLNSRFVKDKAFLHANAIRVLPNNDIMVSIRNYDQVVIIRDEKILKRFKDAPGVHDPSGVIIEENEQVLLRRPG